MTETMDRELHLITAACRAAYSGAELPVSGWQKVRWDRLLALADRHRVQALCWRGLGEIQSLAPVGVANGFIQRSRNIVEVNLRAAAECSRLRQSFAAADVKLLFIKGLTLGALAYPEPMLKMGWDIDLLIDPAELDRATRLLRDAGYQPIEPPSASNEQLSAWHVRRKESVWQQADGGFTIDLHTRLADHPAMLPSLGVASPSQMIAVAGGIELPTLAEDELFAYLCVHGASSAWFRLKWICDFAALLHPEPAEKVTRLYQRSQQLGAGRAADQALLLADRLFGAPMDEELRKQLRSGLAGRWLAGLAMDGLADPHEPIEQFLGTISIHLSQLWLMPGWDFKRSEFARQFRARS